MSEITSFLGGRLLKNRKRVELDDEGKGFVAYASVLVVVSLAVMLWSWVGRDAVTDHVI
jgi:hypothetical protein